MRRATLHAKADGVRIWHPHGVAGKPIAPATLQLGTVAYSKSVTGVRDNVEAFRKAQRLWRRARHGTRSPQLWAPGEPQAWLEARRGDRAGATWIDQVMSSDIAFVGCGLDRAEADLWLMLHERQRQLLRVAEAEKPRAFYIHPWRGFPAHLSSAPGGLTPVVPETHDEAWELLLGRWWA
jgi:hypothetical protein